MMQRRRRRRKEPTIRIRCALCNEKVKLNRACSATIMYYMFVNTTVTFSRGRSLAEAFLGWGRAGSACHGGRLGTRGFVDATGDVSAHESRALIRVAVESCIIFGKLDGDTFDWPTPLAVTVSPLATSAPPRGRAAQACAKTYFQSLPRARWVRMSRGWGVRGGETQSEARVRCAAIFALHRVDTVGHPCLGQARAGARDERVEWGLMGWGLDHR